MHLRVSTALGTPVASELEAEILGIVSDVLIQPDTGRIEGFFVSVGSFFFPIELFLSSMHILAWGTMIRIRSSDYLSEPEDIFRIQSTLADPRHILGQSIVTKKARTHIGQCVDIQFDTKSFRIEWLFPRKYFLLKMPVSATDILEVTRSEIIVKDPLAPVPIEKETAELPGLPEVLSPVRTRRITR